MKKSILITCSIAVLALSACDSKTNSNASTVTDTTKTDTVVAPVLVAPEFNSPEGAVSDGEFLYVSNLGKEAAPSVKDGDGRIMKLSLAADNWVDKDKWATLKLDAPKGLAVLGKTLYATDIDRVVAIDLAEVKEVRVYDFAEFKTQFLNDIAVKNDSTLLISSTDVNAIFELNVKSGKISKLKVNGLNGPNGLVYASEENKIYCVEYGSEKNPKGRVLAIDANTGAVKQLGKHVGGLDGLALTADGGLLFSDWGTAHLEKLDLKSGTVTEVASDSLRGPADLYYDAASHKTYLPCMLSNSLSVTEGN